MTNPPPRAAGAIPSARPQGVVDPGESNMTSNQIPIMGPATAAPLAHRALAFVYGLLAYAIFFATFLYLIGFVLGFGVPKTIDGGAPGSPATGFAVDVALIALFGIQHSIMARPAFKRRWTGVVPLPAERSTFVLASCTCLALLFWQWRPFPELVWQAPGVVANALLGVAVLGWATAFVSTCLIDHFDLFGLRQTLRFATGRAYRAPVFRERFLYRVVRHPLMLGFLIAFWAAPSMSRGHLLFAAVMTGYILLALVVEERTLVALHGDVYHDYRRRVPKLIPGLRRRS
jgi:protein-S-isoprenylcysteine O-methyltransferase Ste14